MQDDTDLHALKVPELKAKLEALDLSTKGLKKDLIQRLEEYYAALRVEEPATVLEEPVKVLEEPVKVLEEPVKVLEEPVKVLEEPVEVPDEPVEVPDEPVVMTEKPMKDEKPGRNNYSAEQHPVESKRIKIENLESEERTLKDIPSGDLSATRYDSSDSKMQPNYSSSTIASDESSEVLIPKVSDNILINGSQKPYTYPKIQPENLATQIALDPVSSSVTPSLSDTLLIEGLQRPYTNPQLIAFLESLAETSSVLNFWLNFKKSFCYASVS